MRNIFERTAVVGTGEPEGDEAETWDEVPLGQVESPHGSNWCVPAGVLSLNRQKRPESALTLCALAGASRVGGAVQGCCDGHDRPVVPLGPCAGACSPRVALTTAKLTYRYRGGTVVDETFVKEQLRKSSPVALVIAWAGGAHHFLLIRGISSRNRLRVVDPSFGESEVASLEEFRDGRYQTSASIHSVYFGFDRA